MNIILGSENIQLTEQVAALFRSLYDGEAEFGISLPLIEGGEYLWLKAMQQGLGRFTQIVLAVEEENVVGYSAGAVKILPSWYGSKIVGYWDSMYLLSAYRGRGLGDAMTRELMLWWRSRNATVFEGERQISNSNAVGNYERLGFKAELVKYRRSAVDR